MTQSYGQWNILNTGSKSWSSEGTMDKSGGLVGGSAKENDRIPSSQEWGGAEQPICEWSSFNQGRMRTNGNAMGITNS